MLGVDKLNVCYILPYTFGGLPEYTAELANAVAVSANVYVVVPKGCDGRVFSGGVSLLPLLEPAPTEPLSVASLLKTAISFLEFPKQIRAIRELAPDVIHLTTLVTPQLFLAIRRNGLDRQYPVVLTVHAATAAFAPTNLECALSRVCLSCARQILLRKVIVHGERDRDRLIRSQYFRIAPADIEVIPHFAYSLCPTKESQSQISGTDRHSILFFGRIRQYKGLECLLKAVPIVAARVGDIRVIVAGEGDLSPYRALIDSSARMLEIHNHFIPREELADLFGRAKVVVLPYLLMEGQSGVLHLAMTFGKPVVATAVGDISEVVQHGINGLLVPPNNPEKLAEAVVTLLTDDELRNKISHNLASEIARRSAGVVARAHLRVYEDAIRKARGEKR